MIMRAWFSTEDVWAVWLGLLVVILALPAAVGIDLLGWAATPEIWLDPARAVRPLSKSYAGLPGLVSLILTYLLVLALAGLGAFALRLDLRKFLPGFTLIFWI